MSSIYPHSIKQQVSKTIRRINNLRRRTFIRIRDSYISSFSATKNTVGDIGRLIPEGVALTLREEDNLAIRHYLNHIFNLLGSGWLNISYGMQCVGFEGTKYSMRAFSSSVITNSSLTDLLTKPNKEISARIRGLISDDYEPIDWQLDFKSGFRWSERTWYKDIRYGMLKGVDVKVPWELSRMQHLIEMAAGFSINGDAKLKTEFCDQVLDWIAANPPRFGVNWACTMDVAIRVANWLVAYDLFCSAGAQFNSDFKEIFINSLTDHTRHIVKNLEWAENHRSNHYLANIAGLLIAAIYLPSNKQTNTWLVFAIQELLVETERQFLDDGSHFEASTNYHRLCSEMISVCAVFLEALSKARVIELFKVDSRDMHFKPGLNNKTVNELESNYRLTGRLLNDKFYNKLFLAAQFTHDLTKHDGTVPQIGDNDSGRFIRIGGWIQKNTCSVNGGYKKVKLNEKLYLEQEHLNHQQSLAWASSLWETKIWDEKQSKIGANVRALAISLIKEDNKLRSPEFKIETMNFCNADDWIGLQKVLSGLNYNYFLSSVYKAEHSRLFTNAKYINYTDFGVYIVRSDHIHLTIRCGSGVNDSYGVHAHDDQLSFELMVDQKNITLDPGSYVYSSSIQMRNKYRSSFAHCAPSVQGLFENTTKDIFSCPSVPKGECLYFGQEGFVGKIIIEPGQIIRRFIFHINYIEIQDYYILRDPWKPASNDLFQPAIYMPFSSGYGIQNI